MTDALGTEKRKVKEGEKDRTLGYTTISGVKKQESQAMEGRRKAGKDAVRGARASKHSLFQKGRRATENRRTRVCWSWQLTEIHKNKGGMPILIPQKKQTKLKNVSR